MVREQRAAIRKRPLLSRGVLVSAADGSSRVLTVTPLGSTMGRGRFSPNGNQIYYVEWTGPAESRLNQIELAGGAPKPVTISGLRSIQNFAWWGANELILAGTSMESVIPRLYRVSASGGTPSELPFGTKGSVVDTFPGAGALVYCNAQMSENIFLIRRSPIVGFPRKFC